MSRFEIDNTKQHPDLFSSGYNFTVTKPKKICNVCNHQQDEANTYCRACGTSFVFGEPDKDWSSCKGFDEKSMWEFMDGLEQSKTKHVGISYEGLYDKVQS